MLMLEDAHKDEAKDDAQWMMLSKLTLVQSAMIDDEGQKRAKRRKQKKKCVRERERERKRETFIIY